MSNPTSNASKSTTKHATKIVIGWREWAALPGLNLPAIKAKVDTGARTSALHSFDIQPYYERGILMVRFKVHPVQGRNDIVVSCNERVTDYRLVSDSGGHRERRYVIVTDFAIGELCFPIEITLANRESMTHRMLFGRNAMKSFVIEPGHSYMLGRPSKISSLYSRSTRKAAR